MRYVKAYLIFMSLVWLPWGLICVFNTGQITDIIGVTSIDATGNTDLRVMYGGFQLAIGLMAVRALFNPLGFAPFVYALAFLGSCMALSRIYGLAVDGSATFYTWGVLAFEAFAGISAMLWLRRLRHEA